jgi:hypothetical protein
MPHREPPFLGPPFLHLLYVVPLKLFNREAPDFEPRNLCFLTKGKTEKAGKDPQISQIT